MYEARFREATAGFTVFALRSAGDCALRRQGALPGTVWCDD